MDETGTKMIVTKHAVQKTYYFNNKRILRRQIAAWLAEGKPVRVVDSETAEDITDIVMRQHLEDTAKYQVRKGVTPSPHQKCEVCKLQKVATKHHTICHTCDDAVAEREELAAYVENYIWGLKRKCRRCKSPLSRDRYYDCVSCVPDSSRETAVDPSNMLPNKWQRVAV